MEEKLREAASLRDHDAVKLLLSGGINVNHQNRMNGWTALHWASKRGDVAIVKTLLTAGADASIQDNNGVTPAQVANGEDVRALFGDNQEPSSSSTNPDDSPVGFTPSYLRNPIVHKDEYYKDGLPSISQNIGSRQESSFYSPPAKREFLEIEKTLILKVRIEGQRDFIEVDLERKNLDLQSLISLSSKELEIDAEDVEYVRKLPNTKLRRDLDIKRLKEYQELELVVNNI